MFKLNLFSFLIPFLSYTNLVSSRLSGDELFCSHLLSNLNLKPCRVITLDFISLSPPTSSQQVLPILHSQYTPNPVPVYHCQKPFSCTVISIIFQLSLLSFSSIYTGYINTIVGVPDKIQGISYCCLLTVATLHHAHLSKHISGQAMLLFKLSPLSITEFIFFGFWLLVFIVVVVVAS